MLETTSPLSASNLVTEIKNCRACGSGALSVVLDLGTHAVSDFYWPYEVVDRLHPQIEAEEAVGTYRGELRAPLTICQCAACGLAQLTHSVSKERLYRDYWYKSGTNEAMVRALKDVVQDARARLDFSLNPDDYVVDIGANDGTLLAQYETTEGTEYNTLPIRVGFEPAKNLAHLAENHADYVVPDYFSAKEFQSVTAPYNDPDRDNAFIVTSIAMFYDLDDPNRFVRDVKSILYKDGVWINQMMDLDGMLHANAFDNICHEHVGYWRAFDFDRLVDQHGLQVVATSRNDVNGGSIRSIVRHGHSLLPGPLEPTYFNAFRMFAKRVELLRDQCLAFLEECRQDGKTVLGYGASTKGNTLLQYYGITPDLLPAIAERNGDKIGKVTAGSHIPIISEAEMRERKPDYLLILPWHFLDGFLQRERELREGGTRFVVPLPTFRVV